MEEKKSIRAESNRIGLTLICYWITLTVAMFGYMFVRAVWEVINHLDRIKDDQYINALNDQIVDEISTTGIFYIIGICLGMLLIYLYRDKKLFTYDMVSVNRKMSLKAFVLLFICFMAPQFIMGLVDNVAEAGFNYFGYSIMDQIESASAGSKTISMLLYTVVVGPISEEIIFRGAVLRGLEKYGKGLAILVSAILFGSYHSNLTQGLFAAMIGLVLGYVASEYSLKWAILMHVLNNGISELLSLVEKSVSEQSANILEYGFSGGLFLMGVGILIWKRKRFLQYWRENKPGGKQLLYVFSSIGILIFVLGNLLLAIMFIEKLA